MKEVIFLSEVFDNIRAEISRHRWSVEEFCDKLGIQRTRFYRWEKTGDFPISYLKKMSKLLGVSPDTILCIREDNNGR